ncbi:MAG: aldo/keto reductase [Pseudomonadales bacterium]|nr:aldo/keto reductase [Pseudomonadales bacterium]
MRTSGLPLTELTTWRPLTIDKKRLSTQIPRRSFLHRASTLAVATGTLVTTGDLKAARSDASMSVEGWPDMEYRTLGNTGFSGSRLVFGCGAALSSGQANHLLEPALEAGMNVFDVGFEGYYRNAERNLAPFLKRHGDDIFLISKAYAGDFMPNQPINTSMAKSAAQSWSRAIDRSLKGLGVEHMDAYYLMAANNVELVRSEEVHEAFLAAKSAGKVSHYGLSTHENAENVLLAATGTGWYSLAQIAITPAGWYDWASRSMVDDGKSMKDLRPVLDAARNAGIGLIGMKAGRYIAGRRFLGWGKPDAFNEHYDRALLVAPLTAFQRSYAYVLAHGLDAVNADMQVWKHMRENVAAATSAQRYFV